MTYLIIILSFLISLSSFLFRTTREKDGSDRKRLTYTGWFILFSMLAILVINFFNEHAKKEVLIKDALLAKAAKKNDSLKWELQKNNFQFAISKARQDSINAYLTIGNLAEIKQLQNTALGLSATQNESLKERLRTQEEYLEKQLYPLDSITLSFQLNISDSGIAKKFIERLTGPSRDLVEFPDSARPDEAALYHLLNSIEMDFRVFDGPFDWKLFEFYKTQKDRPGSLEFGAYFSLSNESLFEQDYQRSNSRANSNKLTLHYESSARQLSLSAENIKLAWTLNNRLSLKSFKDILGKLIQVDFPGTPGVDGHVLEPEYINIRCRTGATITVVNFFGLIMRLSSTQFLFHPDSHFAERL